MQPRGDNQESSTMYSVITRMTMLNTRTEYDGARQRIGQRTDFRPAVRESRTVHPRWRCSRRTASSCQVSGAGAGAGAASMSVRGSGIVSGRISSGRRLARKTQALKSTNRTRVATRFAPVRTAISAACVDPGDAACSTTREPAVTAHAMPKTTAAATRNS